MWSCDCSLLLGTAAFSSRLSGRVKIATTACCIHVLACMSYLMMYYDLMPLVATSNTGRTMVVTRVFEWSVTVPLLLSLIGTPSHHTIN